MPAPFDPEGIFRTLDGHGVEYVLIGGLAAVLRGSTAMTSDADIVPASDTDNLERLSGALVDLEARLRSIDTPDGVGFDPHPTLLASMAMLNTTTRCGDLDINFRPAALDDFEALAAASDRFELAGCIVRVAALADIISSKARANRPKDRATLPILRALAEELRDQS